jgi:4-amino-4-deoxy-L-arabinose transferase-like glycosyltransferase
VRRLWAFVPRAAWLCALVAVLNAGAWALLTPPLQGPDEQAHLYYVQYLAQTAKVPKPGTAPAQSEEEQVFEAGVHRADIVGNFYGKPLWTKAEAKALEARLNGTDRRGGGGDLGVASYTPLYYATLVPAWWAAELAGGNEADRLIAMRLVSALYAGLTVLFAFLFLSELLPRRPETWLVGALACALLPYFGFIAGAVNPDAGLVAASTALFFFVARGFRTRLSPVVAVGIGATAAAAVLMKLAGAGLVPGAALAVLVLALRGRRRGESVSRGVWLATAVAAAPIVLYLLVNTTFWGRPLAPSSGGVGVPGLETGATGSGWSLHGLLTYAWQYGLPRLGFMSDWFSGYAPYNLWWRGWVGRFGWGDSGFSDATVRHSFWVLLVLLAGCVVEFVRHRFAVRRRAAELAVYAVLAAGLMLLLAWVGYGYRSSTHAVFEQGRYLFPLMALFGAIVGIGVGAFGRRLVPAVAVTVLLLEAALLVGGFMITFQRYYA